MAPGGWPRFGQSLAGVNVWLPPPRSLLSAPRSIIRSQTLFPGPALVLAQGGGMVFLGAGPTRAAVHAVQPKTIVAMPPLEDDPLTGRILTIRGQRVILDTDLARLYGVPTFRFNEAVKRNAEKFPEDFRFQLTKEEAANLISQFAISNSEVTEAKRNAPRSSQIAMTSRRFRAQRYLPWAFNEHGCLMAATVLNSPRAVQMSLYVIRAFVQMREALTTNATILRRLAEIDKTLLEHNAALLALWKKLRPLLAPAPDAPKRRIGFHPGNR